MDESKKFNQQFEAFTLNPKEFYVLSSLQSFLVSIDIDETKDPSLREKKIKWRDLWHSQVFKPGIFGFFSEKAPQTIDELIKRLNDIKPKERLALILVESALFTPYFNIQMKGGPTKDDVLTEENRDQWQTNLMKIADKLKEGNWIHPKLVGFIEIFSNEFRTIEPRKFSTATRVGIGVSVGALAMMLTGGAAAPVVGGMIGSLMGFSGAAATSAGLAFLGGGAMTTGGLGMAGGTTFIIGGAGILGGYLGTSLAGGAAGSRTMYAHSNAILIQASKLNAVIKSEIFELDRSRKLAFEIIDAYTSEIEKLKTTIDELESIDPESGDIELIAQEIKTLEKSMKIFLGAKESLLKWL